MTELIKHFLELKNWKDLNEIQKEAVKCGILDGKGNFLVFAPTGSGKTRVVIESIVEYKISQLTKEVQLLKEKISIDL